MTISIGGIDLASAILEALHRISVLEKIVEAMAQGRQVTQSDIDGYKDDALKDLQKRFPDAGISKK
jgi:hypothetical protein